MTAEKPIGIGEFRQRATEIIRRVEETAQSVTIARRGKPVVEIRAMQASAASLLNSVDVSADFDLSEPVVDPREWDATR
ncbi:MAG: type II toxin-antitoxin system Phd/YefM family antitoxin [Acidimicrobiia bacterium]